MHTRSRSYFKCVIFAALVLFLAQKVSESRQDCVRDKTGYIYFAPASHVTKYGQDATESDFEMLSNKNLDANKGNLDAHKVKGRRISEPLILRNPALT